MTPAHTPVLSLGKRWLSDVLPPAIKQELDACQVPSDSGIRPGSQHPASMALGSG